MAQICREKIGNKRYKVAYIPHIDITISPRNHTFYRAPQWKDIEKYPNERNLILGRFMKKGVEENIFRLYADYQHPSGPFGGREANVDLSPIDDSPVILYLLKIAEKIFPPGEVDQSLPINMDADDT